MKGNMHYFPFWVWLVFAPILLKKTVSFFIMAHYNSTYKYIVHRPYFPHPFSCLWGLSLFQNLPLVNTATNKHGCTSTCDIYCLQTFKVKIPGSGIAKPYIPYHSDIRYISGWVKNFHIYLFLWGRGWFASHQYTRVPFHMLLISLSTSSFTLILLPVPTPPLALIRLAL